MKRWMVRICAFLVLGAIVNIAVAWALNLMPYSAGGVSYSYLPDEDDLGWWRTRAPLGFPAQPAGVFERRLFGRQSVLMYEHEADANSNTLGDNVGRFRSGWPCASMESALWVNRKTRSVVEQNRSYVPKGWPFAGRWVPVEPIWPGFAINTMFYAAALWLLFAALFALRRRRRIKRGLCPKCAYDLRGSVVHTSVCPECGSGSVN